MYFSCQDKLLPGDTYTEKYVNAIKIGFDSIELNVSPLLPLKQRVEEIKKASAEAGIKPSTVCGGYRGWIGHFDREMRMLAIQDMKDILEAMPETGASGLIIPAAYGMFSKKLPPFKPPREEAEDREVLVDGLSTIGEYAKENGLVIFLEPLNRYEDHMVNTVASAVEIVRAVDLPSVRVMLDFFHANIEEADLAGVIHTYGNYIGHIHLADSNRLQPGKGNINFGIGLGALKDIGYEGFCALECGVDSTGTAPLEESLGFLKKHVQD